MTDPLCLSIGHVMELLTCAFDVIVYSSLGRLQ